MYNSLLKWLSKYGVEYFLSNILVSLRIHLLNLRQNAGGDKFPIFVMALILTFSWQVKYQNHKLNKARKHHIYLDYTVVRSREKKSKKATIF